MIYFIRHGESEANARKVFAGQRDDSLLTETGREQARATAEEIKKEGIRIDRIVSSPQKRTMETAQIVAKELGYDIEKIIPDPRVMEYDMGDITGTPWHEVSSQQMISGGGAENPQYFLKRISSCVEDLQKLDGNTLLSSHGGVGRVLESIKQGVKVENFYDIPVYKNATVIELDWIEK